MIAAARIVAARRTPVAPRMGALRAVEPHALGASAARACLSDAGLPPEEVDEIVVGSVLGIGGNPARLIALAAGLPESVAGMTVDRQCCSGLDALLTASALIDSGRASAVLAGGAESYSLRPKCFRATESGFEEVSRAQAPFAPWPHPDPDMIEAAAELARQRGVGRERQEAWAVESHRKARLARERMRSELAPVSGCGLDADAFSRDLSEAVCRRARPLAGTVTPATMSVAADGAAFCLVVSESVASRLRSPGLELGVGITLGGDSAQPGLAAVAAIRETLARARISPGAVACAEIMEAFAIQAIACAEEAGLDPSCVNPGGGSLARGHPIGASGAILAVRLFHELAARPNAVGLAAIAAAGGLGTALAMRS